LEELQLLEQRYVNGEIDLYYGDEAQISEEGYVPYGWQFKDENISIQSANGKRINCFGMITRDNVFEYATTYETINSNFVLEQIDRFSKQIKKHTVIVLDNARVHQSKTILAMKKIWAKRKLFIFYLPPYSPHLNIIERLWKEMKGRWIQTKDYESDDQLFYATKLILNAIGTDLTINFKKRRINTI
jgi:transposase